MAIGSEIDVFQGISFQQQNLWDFYIIDGALTGILSTPASILMKFKVTSCNLPTPGLEVEATKVGKKHYSGRKWEGDYSITVMEDTSFSSYIFFTSWMNDIYNFDTNQWKNNPPSRIGILTYYDESTVTPSALFVYNNLKIRGIQDITQNRETAGPLTLQVNLTFEKLSFVPSLGLPGAIQNIASLAGLI